MVDMEPHRMPQASPNRNGSGDDDVPLQPVPTAATTLRLTITWHWASAGQHFQASRAREQMLQEMHELCFLSTIYLLIVGTLAVAGVLSGGNDRMPPFWRRDVWAAIWVGDFFLITQVAVLGFYMFCAVNACDDDAEVLRILDGLDYLAVLPHQLFTLTTLWTCAGLVYWCYMDFGITVTVVMAAVLGVTTAASWAVHFAIVRASVSSKARPVEGPEVAGALRRAASKANLLAQMGPAGAADDGQPLHTSCEPPLPPLPPQPRRSALRRTTAPLQPLSPEQHAAATGAARHVQFVSAADAADDSAKQDV